MIKKLLLVLGIIVFAAGSAFAYSMPRWMAFPLSVYLPPDAKESAIVRSAFDNWASNSKNIARFMYKKSNVAKKNSNINVEFYDKLPSGKAYEVREVFVMTALVVKGESGGYYYHVDIKIATKDADGKPYTRQQLSAISLQAVGRALGVPCQQGERGAMVCDEKYNVYSITKEDYDALFKVYRKTKKVKD